MPYSNLPSYVVNVNVKLDSVNQANVQVTLRNERTNNSSNLITNSDGDVVFDAANISGGVATSDVLTAFCFYTNYEASSQHTVTEGGTIISLTLSSVPSSGSLKYYTVQQFYESYGYPLNDNNTELIRAQEVIRVGVMIEAQIDEELGTKFDSNSSSYYTQTEYIDTNENNDTYHLTTPPIISVSSLRTTQSDENSAPDISTGTWDTLTSGTHYVLNTETGRVFIVTDQYKPITRRNGLYASYTYGKATVPQDIKRLAILMTMEHFWMGNIMKNVSQGRKSSITSSDVSLIRDEIRRIRERYKTFQQKVTP